MSIESTSFIFGLLSGKKRAWIPDEKEAYIEIEIKEFDGDKVIVETRDKKVCGSWNAVFTYK